MKGLENGGCFLVTMLNGLRHTLVGDDGNVIAFDRSVVLSAIDRDKQACWETGGLSSHRVRTNVDPSMSNRIHDA